MRRVLPFLIAAALAPAAAAAESWTLLNPTGRAYANEPVRLNLKLPAGPFLVQEDGKEVPYQVEELDGARCLWVAASLGKGQKHVYSLAAGTPAKPQPKVQVRQDGDAYVLDNGLLAVRVPASGKAPVPPVLAVRLPDGTWVGKGSWRTARALKQLTAEVIGDGTIFGKVRLRYEFDGTAGLNGDVPAFAVVDVALEPGRRHATIEESHEMSRGDYWEFDAAAGWKPNAADCVPHSGGFGRPDLGAWPPNTLKTGQTRMGDVLLNLLPRWSQSYDDGWFFSASDGANAVGALAARAGKWFWPHSNRIEVRVKESGDYAGMRGPTWKGRRYWFLLAGPQSTWAANAKKEYAFQYSFEPLDKLNREFILDWPGLEGPKAGGFSGMDLYHGDQMNPTGSLRSYGRNAVKAAGTPGNLSTLTRMQVMLHPDTYGSYWLFWSPENPNFLTDFVKGPIAHATQLKAHPRFRDLAKAAELKFREDLYHSVTLPGGAGQECPGYIEHAMGTWFELAEVCKTHLGFDAREWPQFKAAASFILHSSQPVGGGARAFHPGGDTHPGKPDPVAFAAKWGVADDVKALRTEELPGFGVIFRSRPGSEQETYLAFKSGPNRGHYHGDQLSFHYCPNAKPWVVDHHCSYKPRAGQEHMHNRVAFHTEKLPYANMDGYERLIALKTTPDADAAIGQVESERLRVTERFPPEQWDWYLPEERFGKPLQYRRSVVCLKNKGQDYFVFRDQYAGPDVFATYCLHVYGSKCEQKGPLIAFDNLTVFVAAPARFEFSTHDWSHENGGPEATKGLRLTVKGPASEFITVLCPGAQPPAMTPLANGVKVGEDEVTFGGGIDDQDATAYVTVRRDGKEILMLTGKDVDLDRSQGEIGLFVPDAGYPFGEIPDWLIKQRSKRPEWYQEVWPLGRR